MIPLNNLLNKRPNNFTCKPNLENIIKKLSVGKIGIIFFEQIYMKDRPNQRDVQSMVPPNILHFYNRSRI